MADFLFLFVMFMGLSVGPYLMSDTHPNDLMKYEKPTLLDLALLSCGFSKSIDKKDKVALRSCVYCIMELLKPQFLRKRQSSSSSQEDETLKKYKEEELNENLTEPQVAGRFCAQYQQMTTCHHDDQVESGIQAACVIRELIPAGNTTRMRAQCNENGAIRDCTSGFQGIDLTQPLKCATYEKWSRCLTRALGGCPGSAPVESLLRYLRSTATDCNDDNRNGDTVEIRL